MAAQVETSHQGGGGGGGDVSVTAGDPSQSQSRTNNIDDDVVATTATADASSIDVDEIEKTRTLICALNFLSRNLPLPHDVYDAVSSIYQEDGCFSDADIDSNSDGGAADVCNPVDDSTVVGGGGVGSDVPAVDNSKVQVSNIFLLLLFSKIICCRIFIVVDERGISVKVSLLIVLQ